MTTHTDNRGKYGRTQEQREYSSYTMSQTSKTYLAAWTAAGKPKADGSNNYRRWGKQNNVPLNNLTIEEWRAKRARKADRETRKAARKADRKTRKADRIYLDALYDEFEAELEEARLLSADPCDGFGLPEADPYAAFDVFA